ncbi:MAG: 5-deoxy-glucuronate isomerase [Acidimicrobiales bacterium]
MANSTTPTLHYPAGTLATAEDKLLLTQARAGWTHTGLRVIQLDAGETRTIATGNTELVILPLSGGAVSVTVKPDDAMSEDFELEGRTTVFSRVTDFLYIGRDAQAILNSAVGCELALPMARCENTLPPKYGPADQVETEARGGGPATRQVTNFLTPERWGHADKLMCCELLTPDGNWSSYPPHKHDDSPACTVNNEEIYYFRIGRADTTEYDDDGFGHHRTYTGPRDDPATEIDQDVTVRNGDVFLVPRGYHGPCVAAPGYPMYYLNVLAGPAGDRSMAFCDDPTHHWVRETWNEMGTDPRCPMTNSSGVV